MPGVTEDMLARVMAVDFDTMAARSRAVADVLDRGTRAHVTCPKGTDWSSRSTAGPGSPTTASSARGARSGTCRAARASSRRRSEKARWCRRAWRRSGSARSRRRSRSPRDGSSRPTAASVRGHRAAAVSGRARDQSRRARGGHERPGAADGQHPRGREDSRHGARRVRRECRHRRHGVGSDPLDVVILDASLEVDGQTVLDHGRYVLK